MIAMSESGPDIQRVPSDSWTGGDDEPDLGRTKLDDWVDAHPLVAGGFGIFALAAVSTWRAIGHATVSWIGAIETFTFALLGWTALYGSMIGGLLLFGKLTGRIERASIDHLTMWQKRYVLGLVAVLLVVSVNIGPFTVQRLLALVGVTL